MILEQIDRITGIIQALLNMARPRESLRTAVDLSATLDTTLAFLTEKLRRRHVSVTRNVDDVPSVTADPEKLQQVFLNLLINAVDAMPEGGTLSIALEREGAFVVVRIADSGTGIPHDQIDNIFEPFYTTKPAGRGNGLGLVVVKGIMDEHDGSIDVRSEEGSGTEFTVRFPA
jgi:signal transduction histidine kinase